MFYQVDETARLQAVVTDINEVAADPATVKITIKNPKGSKVVSSIDMTNDAVGSYYYDYLCPSILGEYDYKIVAVGSDDRVTIVKDSFHVNESIG